MSNECGCSCSCSGDKRSETLKCPVCGKNSIEVTIPLVSNMLKPNKQPEIVKDDKYFLCMDSECPVSYFGKKGKPVFKAEDIKVPLWYKTGVAKKVACYCNNITFEQVREQVMAGKKSWKEIVGAYRKKPICKCYLLNPTGNCCTSIFYDVVNKTLKEAGKEVVSQEDIDQSGCC
ncbi:MAG: hypothetical protein ABIH50_07580 [bacterium]